MTARGRFSHSHGAAFQWGVQAGAMEMSPWTVVPAFVAARALRMSLFALVAWAVGVRLRSVLRRYAIAIAAGYVVVFGIGLWVVGG